MTARSEEAAKLAPGRAPRPARNQTSDVRWVLVAAAALSFASAWLLNLTVGYFAAGSIATLAAAAAALRMPRSDRRWPLTASLVLAAFFLLAADAQWNLRRAESDWPAVRASMAAKASREMEAALSQTAARLVANAARALEAPEDRRAALEHLRRVDAADGDAEHGVVLYRGDDALAWSGQIRVPVNDLTERLGTAATPFYLTMFAVARRGDIRAIATALVHATPPADRIARPLDRTVAANAGAREFVYALASPGARDSGWVILPGSARDSIVVRPVVPAQEQVRVDLEARALLRGVLVLAIAIMLFLAVAWRRLPGVATRLATLGVALAALAVTPLNRLSNESRLLDPSLYFASLGGPFTASPAAFALSAMLIVLGLLAILRSSHVVKSRPVALTIVLAAAAAGPFLMRDLARGIAPPAWSTSTQLWLAWEAALFLVGTAVLLIGATAGRAALGAAKGISPAIAPALGLLAALLAPITLRASGAWPPWYPLVWALAIIFLALARRSRTLVVAAALVAGAGAETLVWGNSVRRRIAAAERDVEGLRGVDSTASMLVSRFGEELRRTEPPRTRAAMLQLYTESDLSAANYPLVIAAWNRDRLETTLSLAQFRWDTTLVASAVADALQRNGPVQRAVPGVPGAQLLLIVPHDSVRVTTILVAPRTVLIVDDPFLTLLGVIPDVARDPPYTLITTEAEPPNAAERGNQRWVRDGNELHGDWLLDSPGGPVRAHVEVDLRPYPALIQRGALVLIFDLSILALLWALAAAADGGLGRWVNARRRVWTRSYRARLTVALFTFFVLPACALAVWAFGGVQASDRQARELLVRETLRAVPPQTDEDVLHMASERVQAPLFLYDAGELEVSSDPLYDELVPLGRYVPPGVHRALVLSDEVWASSVERVGSARVLLGYKLHRAPRGVREILAAPGRTDEVSLDQRRADLGILLLFALFLGAAAALWLSGVAAREFARPIRALRSAALAIAQGKHEPPLEGRPPAEFMPVFSAFRRMDSDLSESRAALEESQRRTTAILRNVASGVIAVDRGGIVTLSNPRANALLGRVLPSGAALPEIGEPALAPVVRRFLDTPEAEEEEFDLEMEGRQLHARLTRLTRGAAGAVVTLDDVTELARAQRVLAWGEMARQVAHEIKNPLTPIRLGVQHLKRARADARPDFDRILDQNVGRILEEIDRLDEIARAFSRYGTAPAQQSAGTEVDIAEIVRDVVALETLGEDTIEWNVDAEEPAPGRAAADELREVMLNIFENARHAHASTVSVAVARRDGKISVSVTDDGEGIAADLLSRIFEPHFSTRTSGSGLGLAISRRLIEGWGGTISVASEEGRGTRVEIVLEAVISDQ